MPENLRMWVEISFNISYLIVIWTLVLVMQRRKGSVASEQRQAASLVIAAFALLALGDTGHVGFRVWAYGRGNLESTLQLFDRPVGLVGLGALATAYTVTFFYMLVVELWRVRFRKAYTGFPLLLQAAGVVRLVVMALPANDWNAVVPPQPISTLRNLPLMLQGLGVAYLILRDARLAQDKTFGWIGASILISYACYIPVILFVQQAPLLGMLMIPKTLAYVAVGLLAYRDLYGRTRLGEARSLGLGVRG